MSKERPLLVSGPLIGPILRGEKTVTRRLVKINPYDGAFYLLDGWPHRSLDGESNRVPGMEEPYRAPCAVGDVLWARETWAHTTLLGTPITVYNAEDNRTDYGGPWKPSIHMKRADARIFLRVEDVSVERVQDITEEDAIAEGCDWAAPHWPDPKDVPERDEPNDGPAPSRGERGFARDNFARLWDSLAPAGSKWADNPWVWRIGFKLEAPRG